MSAALVQPLSGAPQYQPRPNLRRSSVLSMIPTLLKKHPLHFAIVAACTYPIVKVAMQTEPPAPPPSTPTNTTKK